MTRLGWFASLFLWIPLACSGGQNLDTTTGPLESATPVANSSSASVNEATILAPVGADAAIGPAIETAPAEPEAAEPAATGSVAAASDQPKPDPVAARKDVCATPRWASVTRCRCQRGDTDACLAEQQHAFDRGNKDGAIIGAYTLCQRAIPDGCFLAAYYMKKINVRARFGTDRRKLRARGLGLFQKRCAANDADACFSFGRLALDDARIGVNHPGLPLVQKACDADHGRACAFLANRYNSGLGVKKNRKRARELLEKGCRLDSPGACMTLADKIVKRDKRRAATLYQKVCEDGRIIACMRVATMYSARRDHTEAAAAYDDACEYGEAEACARLADHLAAGKGVEREPARARELYQGACSVGNALGCFGLAGMWARGVGGPRDWGRALDTYESSCEFGLERACAARKRLARQPPDWRCANTDQCRALCDERIARSCTKLGDLLLVESIAAEVKRRKTEPEPHLGWDEPSCSEPEDGYSAGCRNGDPRGCLLAGHLASTIPEARGRYDDACELGDRAGCVWRDFIGYQEEKDPRRRKKTRRTFEARCKRGANPAACTQLALLVRDGDDVRAERLLRSACDRKHARACRLLGAWVGHYDDGPASGVCCGGGQRDLNAEKKWEKERQRGRALLATACQLGDRKACEAGDFEEKVAAAMKGRSLELIETTSCRADAPSWEPLHGLPKD